jgi:cytochrome c553
MGGTARRAITGADTVLSMASATVRIDYKVANGGSTMTRLFVLLFALIIATGAVLFSAAVQAADNSDWAYPVNPPPPTARDNVKAFTLPGSAKQYTEAQVNDGFSPPDWYPDEHPPMPHIVSNGGPRPAGLACALCHLTSGDGHPESANIAGQTENYIVRQMAAFKSGERKNVRATPMINMAKVLSDEEIRDSARYFSALKPRAGYYKVVETQTVPKTYLAPGAMRLATADGATEPLGNRIITVPQNPETVELRDPHFGFVANVPPGNLKRGEELAMIGAGKTIPCGICHGDNFRGLANIPPIAGQHAIYIYRQLHDMRDGDRKGGDVVLMAKVVEHLSDDDMMALAAFMASRDPQ